MAIVIAVFQKGRGTSETLKDSQRAERYDEQSNRKCLCESLFLIPDLGFLTRVSGNLLEARQQEQAGGWRAGGGGRVMGTIRRSNLMKERSLGRQDLLGRLGKRLDL